MALGQVLAKCRDLRGGDWWTCNPHPHADASEDEGWLIGFVIDVAARTTDLVILNADDFEGPPQALIHIPHLIPPGFHGNWIASSS